QVTIISRLVDELMINSEIRVVPTTREASGLALSSRNMRLKPEERPVATIFYKVLTYAKNALTVDRVDFSEVRQRANAMFRAHEGLRLEYIELVDSKNLKSIRHVEEAERPIICIAGYVGEVRLI